DKLELVMKKSSMVLKIAITLFVLVLLSVYYKNYGWQNFLWLSDIGLFITVGALWLESSFFICIFILMVLPWEIAWNIDFFIQLWTGHTVLDIASYMFDAEKTLFLRGLSLFHVVLPIMWIWYCVKWGYDRRVFIYATIALWIILIITYLV